MGNSNEQYFVNAFKKIATLVSIVAILLTLSFVSLFIDVRQIPRYLTKENVAKDDLKILKQEKFWEPPDTTSLHALPNGESIKYGRELIANTSYFLGPGGTVAHLSNGMNCQNCHLDAGTKLFGNNYSAVASTYPKFRARSGTIETIEKRINDCFERSLNGKPLKNESREMKAIIAYIKWLGAGVKKGGVPSGSGLAELSYLERSADPLNGKKLYETICSNCHGKSGQGILKETGLAYTYPPLWGKASYNWGAGIFRVSTFARFIKTNMPLGATFDNPILTDEQSWDIAAYVNSLPRPQMDLSTDWPDISKKPIDHPFGPYSDNLSQTQHKFGPFKPMLKNK